MRDVVLKSALLDTGDDVRQWRGREQGNDGCREGRRVIIISTKDGNGWTNGWERVYFNFTKRASCCDFDCYNC